MSPPQYTFLATDLVTNIVLGELPVNGVTLDGQLNSAGNMGCSANLDDPRIDNAELLARTTPGRTAFWAYRENTIVWGGVIWTREYDSVAGNSAAAGGNTKTLALTGQTFESYAARRFPRSWLSTSVTNYNQGQISIIDDLWRQLQSVPNGSIGVQPFGSYPANDTVRQLTVNGWDLSTSVDALIQNVIAFSDGPDYTVTWTEDGNGLPLKQLQLGVPIGNPITTTDLVLDYPGGVSTYSYIENASTGANQWWATGDGSDATTTAGVATDQNVLNSGWPLLEGVNNFSGVTDQSIISKLAQDELQNFPTLDTTYALTLAGNALPEFGSYGMGDFVTVNVQDPRFPFGAQFNIRIIGWSIIPPDTSNGTEQVTPVLFVPPVPAIPTS